MDLLELFRRIHRHRHITNIVQKLKALWEEIVDYTLQEDGYKFPKI